MSDDSTRARLDELSETLRDHSDVAHILQLITFLADEIDRLRAEMEASPLSTMYRETAERRAAAINKTFPPKSAPTETGASETASDTTPTCGSGDDVNVTPEMIEAGQRAFAKELWDTIPPNPQALERVYRAMEAWVAERT